MTLGFVYAGGRLHRLEEMAKRPESVPSEFFYGALELKEQGMDVLHDEIDENTAPKFLRWLDHRWGLKFPLRFTLAHFFSCLPHLKKWNACDCMVATNSQAGMSLGLLKKMGWLRVPLATIHCGIVNFEQTAWRKKLTSALLTTQEIILFARSELEKIVTELHASPEQIHVCDFGVDTKFWNESQAEGDYVFAVGNDSRRDFEIFAQAAASTGFPHKLLTSLQIRNPIPPNMEYSRGGWRESAVSDETLRDHYHQSRCVVVPLIDCLQPSGQSVALQAMACARPLILTKTRGFWLHPDFEDGKHVLLIPPGDEKMLAEKIRFLMENPDEARCIGKAGRMMMLKHYSIGNFAKGIGETCHLAMQQAGLHS